MKKYIFITIIISALIYGAQNTLAEVDLGQKLAGKILLQVENNGEAWYLNPSNRQKYFLDRPKTAFEIMRDFGIGITNQNLEKIQIALIDNNNIDSDQDGLPDDLEIAIGTNTKTKDTDNDGYTDKEEILNMHSPLSSSPAAIDSDFAIQQKGKILLQVERNGEAWYVNPDNNKRYFLGRPNDAFDIMRTLGLGISNNDINKIATGYIQKEAITPPETKAKTFVNPDLLMSNAASAIRKNDLSLALSVFSNEMHTLVEYTLDFLDAEQRLALANILSSTTISKSTETEKTYSTQIYFNGEKHTINFYVKKQENGNWLLTNL